MTLPLGDLETRCDHTRGLAHVSRISFPNDKLIPFLLRGDNSMESATNKYDWDSADDDWELAIKISDYYAAIEIVDGLQNEDSSQLKETLEGLIADINRTGDSGAAGTLAITGDVNISNRLDPNVYTPEQTVFE